MLSIFACWSEVWLQLQGWCKARSKEKRLAAIPKRPTPWSEVSTLEVFFSQKRRSPINTNDNLYIIIRCLLITINNNYVASRRLVQAHTEYKAMSEITKNQLTIIILWFNINYNQGTILHNWAPRVPGSKPV